MKTLKLVYTVGIPSSGKTSWAIHQATRDHPQSTKVIERDRIRARIQNGEDSTDPLDHERPNWKEWEWKWETEVSAERMKQIEEFIGSNVEHGTLIFADTNLNYARIISEVTDFSIRFPEMKVTHEIKVFPVTFDEACRRDAERARGVGSVIIYDMYRRFLAALPALKSYMTSEDWAQWKKYVPDHQPITHGPGIAIVFDIDGTVADHTGLRSPYDWKNVGVDRPREEIIAMINGMKKILGCDMIGVSGRDGSCRDQTEFWLKQNGVDYDVLHMRPAEDKRKDTLIKEEIYFRDIKPYYNVLAWVDDRPVVCRHMRDLGLKVIQVADPHVEF